MPTDKILTTKVSVAKVIEAIQVIKAELQKEIDKWAESFKKNPINSLEWSDSTFERVANLNVILTIEAALSHGPETTSYNEILEWARDQLINKAGHFGRSTALASNVLEHRVVEAWTKEIRGAMLSRHTVLGIIYELAYKTDMESGSYVMYKTVDVKEGRKKIGTTKVYVSGLNNSYVDTTNSPECAIKFAWANRDVVWAEAHGYNFERVS